MNPEKIREALVELHASSRDVESAIDAFRQGWRPSLLAKGARLVAWAMSRSKGDCGNGGVEEWRIMVASRYFSAIILEFDGEVLGDTFERIMQFYLTGNTLVFVRHSLRYGPVLDGRECWAGWIPSAHSYDLTPMTQMRPEPPYK